MSSDGVGPAIPRKEKSDHPRVRKWWPVLQQSPGSSVASLWPPSSRCGSPAAAAKSQLGSSRGACKGFRKQGQEIFSGISSFVRSCYGDVCGLPICCWSRACHGCALSRAWIEHPGFPCQFQPSVTASGCSFAAKADIVNNNLSRLLKAQLLYVVIVSLILSFSCLCTI